MLNKIYRWINWINNKIKYRKKKVILLNNSVVCRGTVFEGNNLVGRNTVISGYLGRGTYLGESCLIKGKIGRYCSVANNVRVVVGRHPTDKYVSTHPCFYSTRKQAGFTFVKTTSFEEIKYAEENYHIAVGNDVWIGENALIYGGVTISDGAVIAAGAVVNKDVAPYTIVGGIPAREVGKRFTDKQREALLEIKWWNFSEEEILEHISKYEDIDSFLSVYIGDN